MTSDRLQKAIERNKAKQARRSSSAPTSVAARRLVSRPEDITFTTVHKKTKKRRKSYNFFSLLKLNKTGKKSFAELFVACGWIVNLFLFLRLLFAGSGVLDFYKTQNFIEQKVRNLELMRKENIALASEVHLLKTNPAYQKELTRDHLGVIAQDEYMVIFAKN